MSCANEPQSLGLGPRVGFTGFVPDSSSAIRSLDIVVHASTDPEPFGLVIAEAMACGKAVVASGAGGAIELTEACATRRDPQARRRARPGDSNCRNWRPIADLRCRLGAAGRATAERCFTRSAHGGRADAHLPRPRTRALMRVLHITSGNLYGGVETFLATLAARGVCRAGHGARVRGVFRGAIQCEARRQRSRSAIVLPSARLSRPLTVLRGAPRAARPAAARVVRRRRLSSALGLRDVRVCRSRSRIPVVLWVHMAGDGRALARTPVPPHRVRTWRSATASSPPSARHLAAGDVDRVRLLPRVDVSSPATRTIVRAASATLKTPADDVVVVQVSRMEAWKGSTVLLSALSHARDLPRLDVLDSRRGPDATSKPVLARPAGAGARCVESRDRVRFIGERNDVRDILRPPTSYCQPNTSPEAFGLALHRGAACGVAGRDEWHRRRTRDRRTRRAGSLTEPGDARALSERCARLIGDDRLRTRLGIGGRRSGRRAL